MADTQKAIGIVCEYNPFHRGHAAQIAALRAEFPEKPIVLVMSGNFTQRGEAAITDRYTRARAALSSGADLVLELAFPYSCLGAKEYAKCALSVLERLGCVDTLAFGVRGLDRELILRLGALLRSEAFEARLSENLRNADAHSAYAYVREQTLTSFVPEAAGLLRDPNHILALEYAAFGGSFELCPVERKGEDQASELRKLLRENKEIDAFLPENVARIYRKAASEGRFPADTGALDQALLYHLRLHGGGAFLGFLGERVRICAVQSASFAEFLSRAKTSRVPIARLRRGALLEYLGAEPDDTLSLPLYNMVLGASERGRMLLRTLRKKSRVPLYTRAGDLKRTDDPAFARAVRLAADADAIYAALIGKSGDYFWKQTPNYEQIVNFSESS